MDNILTPAVRSWIYGVATAIGLRIGRDRYGASHQTREGELTMNDTDEPHDDDLEAFIAQEVTADPEFETGLKDVARRQALLRDLVGRRRALDLTQSEVARRMGTTQEALPPDRAVGVGYDPHIPLG